MLRRSFPYYVENIIHFEKNSDIYYDVDDPTYSEDSRQMDEFNCTHCGHLYKGNDIDLIVLDEMVEKK
jgi:hypothetical protein